MVQAPHKSGYYGNGMNKAALGKWKEKWWKRVMFAEDDVWSYQTETLESSERLQCELISIQTPGLCHSGRL